MNNRMHKLLSVFLALVLAMGSISLVGCGGSSSSSEQDNCYGDDMPVINQ